MTTMSKTKPKMQKFSCARSGARNVSIICYLARERAAFFANGALRARGLHVAKGALRARMNAFFAKGALRARGLHSAKGALRAQCVHFC